MSDYNWPAQYEHLRMSPSRAATRFLLPVTVAIVALSIALQQALTPWYRLPGVVSVAWDALCVFLLIALWNHDRSLRRRHLLELDLRQTSTRLAFALHGADLGIWEWDVASGNLTVNARWISMLGLEAHTGPVTIDTWQSRLHPDDLPRIERLVQDVILHPDGHYFDIEVRARHANGEWIWILDKGAVVARSADGAPITVVGTHLDISLRRRAEAAVRRSEARQAATLASIPDAVISTNRDGYIDHFNPAAAALTGYPIEQAMGRSLGAILRLQPDRTVPASEPACREARLIDANGRDIDVAIHSCPILDSQHNAAGMVLVCHDLSARKAMELALSQSASQLQAFFDFALVGLMQIDPATQQFLRFNKKFARITGYSDEQLMARPFHLLTHPEDRNQDNALFASAATSTRANYQNEKRLVRADGSVIWIRVDAAFVRDFSGKAKLAVATCEDVTMARQANIVLFQREEFARAIADSIPIMLSFWSTDLHCDYANPAYLEWYGCDLQYMLGISKRTLLGETLFAEDEPHFRAALTGARVQIERTQKNHQGQEAHLLVQYVPRRQGDKLVGFLAVLTDISKVKHAQQALASALDESLVLLNEVHHRVKNNLQVIVSLLRLESARSNSAPARVVLGDMQKRLSTMAQLHESIYRNGSFASIDLASYLGEVAINLSRTLQPSPNKIALQLDLQPVQASLDQALPCGLLLNELLSNCFKHAFPDARSGEIQVLLRPEPTSDRWLLRVSDNGIGLPAGFVLGGSGSLGLQLVYDLARQLGSAVSVGPGASFTLTLALTSATPAPLPPKGYDGH